MSHPVQIDRLRGAFFGLAAGDRNGGPIRMAVRLAESLCERGRFEPDDVLARYVAWWRAGAFDTGPVAAEVLAAVAAGIPHAKAVWRAHESTGGMTAGCNPAHRCLPLALAPALADEELAEAAAREASLTHFDPLAGDVAAAVVVLCRSLVRGDAWEVALANARAGRGVATTNALAPDRDEPLDRGGYAPGALRAAIHFVGGRGSFPDALDASLAFAGPANYCPVLVGAIGGARWAASSIPPGMLAHSDLLGRIVGASERLEAGWSSALPRDRPRRPT